MAKNTGDHYVVRSDGKMLCKDGMLREFASFGTYRSCVKVWRNGGFAHRKMQSMNALEVYRGREPDYFVLTLTKGQVLDACGSIHVPEGDSGNTRVVSNLRTIKVVDFHATIPEDQV